TWPLTEIGCPFESLVRIAPAASKPESPHPMGSIRLWQAAHEAIVVWFAKVCCSDSPGLAAGGFAATPGGGDGTSVQRSCSRTISPRRVFDGLSLCEPAARIAPWVSTPVRGESAANMTFCQVDAGAGSP